MDSSEKRLGENVRTRNLKSTRKVISLNSGFTMIELLMVIIIVGALSATAIPQFMDFRKEAKYAAVLQYLQTMRTAIKLQQNQMLLRCNKGVNVFPSVEALQANDITALNISCTAAQVVNPAERKIITESIPPLDSIVGIPTTGDYILGHNGGGRQCETYTAWRYDTTNGDFYACGEGDYNGLDSL
jgi:prepilin-type N-terminal cleavage/methylation domain-containing protein